MRPFRDIPAVNAIEDHLKRLGAAAVDLGRKLPGRLSSAFSANQSVGTFQGWLRSALGNMKQQVADNLPSRGKTENRKSIWWSYFPVILVAIVGASITVAASLQSLHLANNQVEVAFQETSQDRVLVLQRELEYTLSLVQDVASFEQNR